jgi:hypothetical protein
MFPIKKRTVAPVLHKITTTVGPVNSIPSRVYNLTKKTEPSTSAAYIVNNIVKLKLTSKDIVRIENEITRLAEGLLIGIEAKNTPCAWNAVSVGSSIASSVTTEQPVESTGHNPFKTLIKRSNTNLKDNSAEKPKTNRKDLIINSGIKRHCKPIMQIYSHGWPAHSHYACWHCCHKFNTSPVGIPHLLINTDFHCYGNFCSYNCAKKYLRPRSEDDVAMLQTPNDVFIEDDMGEKMQLLELLCHIESGSPLEEPIKTAPSRLTLSLFGGTKSIEEFRENFKSHKSYHVFRSPLVPISYQMEECSDKIEQRKKYQRVSLDTMKIEKAFNDLAAKSTNNKSTLRKLLKA